MSREGSRIFRPEVLIDPESGSMALDYVLLYSRIICPAHELDLIS